MPHRWKSWICTETTISRPTRSVREHQGLKLVARVEHVNAGHARRSHQQPLTDEPQSRPSLTASKDRVPILNELNLGPDSAANHQRFAVTVEMDRHADDSRPMDFGYRFRPCLRRIDVDEDAEPVVEDIDHRD